MRDYMLLLLAFDYFFCSLFLEQVEMAWCFSSLMISKIFLPNSETFFNVFVTFVVFVFTTTVAAKLVVAYVIHLCFFFFLFFF